MPFDLTLDSGLIILIAAFDLYLVARFFQFRKQLVVRGAVPARLVALVILCAVVVWQASQGKFTSYTAAFNVCTVLGVALIAVTPSGLSKEGILCNVMPTPWAKIFYYDIEPYSEKKIRLRAHLAASERNLVFSKDQQGLVEAHLRSNAVMTFAAYKAFRQSRQS